MTERPSGGDLQWLRTTIERAYEPQADDPEIPADELAGAIDRFLTMLGQGVIRVAEPQGHQWSVNGWVQKGIVLALQAEKLTAAIEAGATIRFGAYIAEDVTLRPPIHVDAGAHVGAESTIEPDVSIGMGAQVGQRVQLSTGASLGGVLEPAGARPVVIEDDVVVGPGSGIHGGTIVRRRALLAAGVVLTGSTPVFDVVKGDILRPTAELPLEVPENAVVVPGSRRIDGEWAGVHGLSLQTPVIVKYRDDESDAASTLEEALR